METPATTSKKELKIPIKPSLVVISQNDYKRFGLGGVYVVATLNQGMKRIICPLCRGVGWHINQQWKMKCGLCDANGWANSQDCVDYFTYIEPNPEKLKEVELKTDPRSEDVVDETEKGASSSALEENA